MKRSNIWFASILILSALLLSGAKNVSANAPSPRPAPKPNESAALSDQKSNQQVTPVGASDISHTENRANASEKEKGDGRSASTVVITLFAVITGIATALIALFNWQLVGVTDEMKQATADAAQASKDSAVAAKESAAVAREAVNISKWLERAWIVIEIEPVAYMLREDREDYGIFFKYKMRNFGRSVGWLTGGFEKAVILTEPFPDVPQYQTYDTFVPLAPGQFYSAQWYEQRLFLDADQWLQFALGKVKVALYGLILYRDSVGSYETRFCVYAVPPVHEQPYHGKPVMLVYYFDGPRGYNQYT